MNLLTNIINERKLAEQAAENDRCGTPGYIQPKCPICSRSKGEETASVNSVNLFTLESLTSPSSVIVLKICGVEAAVELIPEHLCPLLEKSYTKCYKVMPKPEGPYLVITNRFTIKYDIADLGEVLGTYHSSALRAYELPVSRDSGTVAPLRRRSRPKKISAESSPRRRTNERVNL
ncbi:uncharacterized protein NPIL_304241 [Nephila pilipes]|uniref:Uncharacterized protein n=1 Tax=Nephila pilipes TaxID=299642 RepID=A0A8X6Q967_NEPPI|nr:uncharacterized protein NPIL_304241 [Nephila pilipes]